MRMPKGTAKKASVSPNLPSNDLRPSLTSSLPDSPADSQPVWSKAQLSTSRHNPPHVRSASAALTSDSGSSAAVKCPLATQACPPCMTAIAAQALLQQVQLSSGHDSEEGSKLGDEKSGKLTDDQTSESVSDIKIDHISPEFTGQLEVSAPFKKQSISAPAPCRSKKWSQALPEPQADSSAKEDEDEGKSLSSCI